MSPTKVTPWQKASASGNTECVELRRNGEAIEIRDSKNPHGAVLSHSSSQLAALLDAAKNGELDHLTTLAD